VYPTDVAPQTAYGALISANIKAQRARLGLTQDDVAARMRAFGFRWHYQTAGAVERGSRPLGAEELAWLAVCLQTTAPVLLLPPPGASPLVTSPDGRSMPSQRAVVDDGSVSWSGNVPEISQASALPSYDWPALWAQVVLAAKQEELRRSVR
jgi:transcriptional regulator with XRE-family HTH domain